MEAYHTVEVETYAQGKMQTSQALIILETSLHISVNGQALVKLACSGKNVEYMTVGFLFSCGLVDCASDIISLQCKEQCSGNDLYIEVEIRPGATHSQGAALPEKTITSGLGWNVHIPNRRMHPIPRAQEPYWEPEAILQFAAELDTRSALYHVTHGCHNAALCDHTGILVHREDIGRHNAIDTLVGQCLMEEKDISQCMILSSGRVASEIAQKAVRAGFPVFASIASATSQAVDTARALGLTLIGNISATGMRIYNDNGQLKRPLTSAACTNAKELQ